MIRRQTSQILKQRFNPGNICENGITILVCYFWRIAWMSSFSPKIWQMEDRLDWAALGFTAIRTPCRSWLIWIEHSLDSSERRNIPCAWSITGQVLVDSTISCPPEQKNASKWCVLDKTESFKRLFWEQPCRWNWQIFTPGRLEFHEICFWLDKYSYNISALP